MTVKNSVSSVVDVSVSLFNMTAFYSRRPRCRLRGDANRLAADFTEGCCGIFIDILPTSCDLTIEEQ